MAKISFISIALSFTFLTIFACSAKNSKPEAPAVKKSELSLVLDEQKTAVSKLIKVAPIIDDDTESYWAYDKADSILGTIKYDDKSFFINESKIYCALDHVFYGMSYTRSVRKGVETLTKLGEILDKPIYGKEDNDSLVLESALIERFFVDAYKFFYFASNMESVKQIQDKEKEFDAFYKSCIADQKENPGRFMALNNKKLFHQTFIVLLYELDAIINQGTKDPKLVDEVMKFAHEQDSIDALSVKKVNSLSDAQFYKELKKGCHMQSVMITELANRIAKIK